jgi:hypothetical protein
MKKLLPLLSCLLLIGCGEKKATGDNDAAGDDEAAGESVTAETEAPASPESRIIGSWRLDKEKSFKALGDLPDSEEAEAVSRFLEDVVELGLSLKFFKGGKVEVYSGDDPPEASTYTAITDDEGVISVDIEGQATWVLREEVLWFKVSRPVSASIGLTRFDASADDSLKQEAGKILNSLSDADVERILKTATESDSLTKRGRLYYKLDGSGVFSGWLKAMYDSGQLHELVRFKNGELDGIATKWHENGQKKGEATFKDGKKVGLLTTWHENGQKSAEKTYKDGKRVSAKYWNSKGEEVETARESNK